MLWVVVLSLSYSDRRSRLSRATDTIETVRRFMEELGAMWGMRREVALNAAEAIYQCLVNISHLGVTLPVRVTARFDELTLNVVLRYQGPAVTLALTPPSAEELVSDPTALKRLSRFLIQQAADKVSVASVNANAHVRLHFDH
jgi:xanthine permease XanP